MGRERIKNSVSLPILLFHFEPPLLQVVQRPEKNGVRVVCNVSFAPPKWRKTALLVAFSINENKLGTFEWLPAACTSIVIHRFQDTGKQGN